MSPLSVLLAPPMPAPDAIGLGEAIAFWILGPLALAGGLGMVFARNAVHSALWLAQAMLCLGALYMVQQAPFLGFVQIIVYTGAIMMLFLFVLMLVGKQSAESVVEVLRGQRIAAGLGGIGLAFLLVATLRRSAFRRSGPVDSSRSERDSGAGEPSGSKAGVATEFSVANTPGPGSGEGRGPRIRASTRSRWVNLPSLVRSV